MAKKKGGRIPKTNEKGRGGVSGSRMTQRQVVTKATEYTKLYSKSETPQERQKRISDTLGLEGEYRSHENTSPVNAPVSNSAATLSRNSQTSTSRVNVSAPVSSHGGSGSSSSSRGGTSSDPNNSDPNKSSGGSKPKHDKKLGKKYASLLKEAKKKVSKDMTAAERKSVVAARSNLRKMRKNLVKKGYGSLSTEKNKKGGYSGRGIYKALTGKSATTVTKKK